MVNLLQRRKQKIFSSVRLPFLVLYLTETKTWKLFLHQRVIIFLHIAQSDFWNVRSITM